jgi:hypothetical protein
MKFILSLLLQAGLGYLITLFFPWWSIVILAFVVGFSIKTQGWAAFIAGFVAMFGLWFGLAMFLDVQNGHLLTERIAQLFKMPANYLPYITGLIGGIIGGMGSLTGNLFRSLFTERKRRYGTRRRKNKYNLNLE